jgi:cephalosporin hydroxylase
MKSIIRHLAKMLIPRSYQTSIKTLKTLILSSPIAEKGFQWGQNFTINGESSTITTNHCQSHLENGNTPSNALEAYFNSHTEGLGILKWKHYFNIYHRHLSKFVGQKVQVLEVGVASGGSREMWKNYFGSNCQIYGVDIEEACKAYEKDSIKIFIGDQTDRNFWKRFKSEVPTLDIVIDDGGHEPEQQIATLEELLPHLRPGGVYICEDIHGTLNQFHTYISGLTHNLNALQEFGYKPIKSGSGLASFSTYFQDAIQSFHLYPFVVVIERSETPVSEFVAPLQGSKWLVLTK